MLLEAGVLQVVFGVGVGIGVICTVVMNLGYNPVC